MSKDRYARLVLLENTSDWRLGGRAEGVFALGWSELGTEEADGLPATDRLPDGRVPPVDCEEENGEELRVRLERCCEGSFALIASARAREAYSASGSWIALMLTLETERNLPGVGIPVDFPGVGIPDILGFPGVVDISLVGIPEIGRAHV